MACNCSQSALSAISRDRMVRRFHRLGYMIDNNGEVIERSSVSADAQPGPSGGATKWLLGGALGLAFLGILGGRK